MNFKYFIGIDVSKKTLDFCLLLAGKTILHLQTENNNKGIVGFIKRCQTEFDLKLEESHRGPAYFVWSIPRGGRWYLQLPIIRLLLRKKYRCLA